MKNTDVPIFLLTDHFPITMKNYNKHEESNTGRVFCKFNNSFIENEEYAHQMKKHISYILDEIINENILKWVKWENLKYNIRKYTIDFSKKVAKNTNKKLLT